MNAVDIDGLRHTYPAARRSTTPRVALNDVSFSVKPGEIFALLGPNGGGKTTLFRILSTALRATAGTARVFGTDVTADPALARRAMGVVFQNPSLDKKLTLEENLRHHGHLYGMSGPALNTKAQDLLKKLGVSDRANDYVENLSGGLQRRGEIAMGLLHSPKLLLMDEPSTGLDVGARRDMWEVLLQLRQTGMTIMLTTHLLEEGEKCDRLAIINLGHLAALGTPAELKSRIGGDVVSIQTHDAATLADNIRKKFGNNASAMDNTVRLEIKDGHKFIPQLVEAFPGSIDAVTVGKPTLEDVFVHETGKSFWTEGQVRS